MTARIDLGATRRNLGVIRSLAGGRAVMACIKGNAYGHGPVPVARCLEAAGVPWLTLGSPDEEREHTVVDVTEAAAVAEGATVYCRLATPAPAPCSKPWPAPRIAPPWKSW